MRVPSKMLQTKTQCLPTKALGALESGAWYPLWRFKRSRGYFLGTLLEQRDTATSLAISGVSNFPFFKCSSSMHRKISSPTTVSPCNKIYEDLSNQTETHKHICPTAIPGGNNTLHGNFAKVKQQYTCINTSFTYSAVTPVTWKLSILPLSLHQPTTPAVFCTQFYSQK